MITIETCPKCGHDLFDLAICTNPPIPKKECHNCGWTWEGQIEVLRVPFNENNTTPIIEPLESFYDGKGERLVDNQMMWDKINEIIYYINK